MMAGRKLEEKVCEFKSVKRAIRELASFWHYAENDVLRMLSYFKKILSKQNDKATG